METLCDRAENNEKGYAWLRNVGVAKSKIDTHRLVHRKRMRETLRLCLEIYGARHDGKEFSGSTVCLASRCCYAKHRTEMLLYSIDHGVTGEALRRYADERGWLGNRGEGVVTKALRLAETMPASAITVSDTLREMEPVNRVPDARTRSRARAIGVMCDTAKTSIGQMQQTVQSWN